MAERLAQLPGPENLTVTFTAATGRFNAAARRAHLNALALSLALGDRFTIACPSCRRATHCLDYDLAAGSCRTCLEVIPRLQATVRGAHVGWAAVRPELHWRPTR